MTPPAFRTASINCTFQCFARDNSSGGRCRTYPFLAAILARDKNRMGGSDLPPIPQCDRIYFLLFLNVYISSHLRKIALSVR